MNEEKVKLTALINSIDNLNVIPPTYEDEVHSNIYKTKDYQKFSRVKYNRKINEKHVLNIVEKIKENNLLHKNPITIDNDFHIIDGQHRWLAAQILGLYLYYSFSEGVTIRDVMDGEIHPLEWTLDQVIDYYSTIGKNEYKIFKDFVEKYNNEITVGLAMELISKNGNRVELRGDFRHGIFDIENYQLALSVVEKLKDIPKTITFKRHTPLVKTFIKLCQDPLYDHKRMIEKMTKHHAKIIKYIDEKNTLKCLENVYNSGTGEKFTFVLQQFGKEKSTITIMPVKKEEKEK